MATFRFTRGQLEGLFGNDYDGIINFELMLQEIDDFSTLGLEAPSISLDTSGFNGLFDSSTTTLQIMADIVDDINTSEVPELGNLYYTDERVDDRVSTFIQNGTGITWVYDDAGGTLTPTVSLSSFTTDDLNEGAVNLYYTDERAVEAVPEEEVVTWADASPITSVTYSGSNPTLINYTDTADITSNSKSITYTGGSPTQLVHTFTYKSEVWEATTDITYTGGKVSSKSIGITRT